MQSIEEAFKSRASNVDSIFSSYRELHEIYSSALETARINPNTLEAFKRSETSAARRQAQISNRLYTQGFVLLTGIAEALLKDVFEDLLLRNFATIKGASTLEFSGEEIQQAIVSASSSSQPLDFVSNSLGKITVDRIYKLKNPSEKLNFQNIRSMQSVFNQYFEIEIPDSDGLKAIHRSWQERHTIVHNDSKIDERFRHNVRQVGLLTEKDRIGSTIVINKTAYDRTENDFISLFRDLDSLIRAAGLDSKFLEV